MDQPLVPEAPAGEITLHDFIGDLKRAKVMMAVMLVALTLAGILIGVFAPKKYKATIVLLPVLEDTGGSRLGSLSSLASEYGGLASLAGISLPGSTMKDQAMAVLESQLLTRQYIEENDLLPVLFAEKWDQRTRHWKVSDPKKVPTLWKAYMFFKDSVRSVVDDKRTGMIEMTIEWKDPKLAAAWANGLVALANSYLRNKAIDEAQRNVLYLDGLVSKTNVVQEQQVIYALMEQQIEKEMVARDREEFALKIVDPAFPPEKPSSPGPVMMGLLGFTLGIFLGIIVIFVRRTLRE